MALFSNHVRCCGSSRRLMRGRCVCVRRRRVAVSATVGLVATRPLGELPFPVCRRSRTVFAP